MIEKQFFKRLLTIAIAITMCLTAISLTSVADKLENHGNQILMAQRSIPSIDTKGTIIEYHDGSPAYFWTIPDSYGDDYFNERMTMPFDGTLDTAYIVMHLSGSTDVTGEGIDIIVWDSDGTYPTTELGRVNIPYVDLVDSAWTTVDFSSLGLSFLAGEEFHIGYTTVNQAAGNIMAVLSDDGDPSPNNLRSSEYYGLWGLMYDDWGFDVDFFIAAEVTETAEPWPDCKMHYPQLPDPLGMDVYASMPEDILADDFMCTETGPITDLHFWGSWFNDIIPDEPIYGAPIGFHISIHADIPDPDEEGPLYSMPGELLWDQDVYVFDCTEEVPSPQGWFEPPGFYVEDNHMHYFRYDILFEEPYYIQEEGTIYWVDIAPFTQPGYLWGWKTSISPHFNDDAVYSIPASGPVTLIDEDFDGYVPAVPVFPPTGWSMQQTASQTWFQTTGFQARCNRITGEASDEWLISSVYDFSSYSQVELQNFVYFYNSSSDTGGTHYYVLGSTDGGATWGTTIDHLTATVYGTTKTYDISSWAAGLSNVKIAYRFVCPSSVTVYDYVYIDNVKISTPPSFGTALFSDGFETWPPIGWTLTPLSGTGAWLQGTGTSHGPGSVKEGTYAAYYNIYNYPSGTLGEMVTPAYDLSTATQPLLTFWWWFQSGSDKTWVNISLDGSTWTMLELLPAATAWTLKTYDLSSYSPLTSVQIKFEGRSAYGSYNPHIDDFRIVDGITPEVIHYSTSFDQIIPSSGWPPAGWTTEVVSGTDTDSYWKINDTATSPSGVIPVSAPYMAEYDIIIISSGNSARMYTPVLDFSGTGHSLSFWMYHDDDSATYNDKVVIQVSTDGSIWTDITEFTTYDPTEGWSNKVVDLSAYDSQPTVYVGFLGVSYYGYNNVYIDDILITNAGGGAGGWGEIVNPIYMPEIDLAFVITGTDLILPEITDLTLEYSTTDDPTWYDVDGDLATGFTLQLDPAVQYYYLDADTVTTNMDLKEDYFGFYVDPLEQDLAFWAAKGVYDGCPNVQGWEPTMWDIINGTAPIFYLKVSDAKQDFMLVDGLQYQLGVGDFPLRVNGDYPLGTYHYTGTVTGVNDAVSNPITAEITFIQNQPPTAEFSYLPLSPTISDIVSFTDESTDVDGTIVSWSWDFDDGDVSYLQNPTHQFITVDTYNVCLTVIDDDGDTDTICKSVVVIDDLVEVLDVNQSVFDRGFPVRHALDGDWGAAQNFTPMYDIVTRVEIYLRKMGTPEFDLVVELRKNGPQAILLDTVVIPKDSVPSSWTWLEIDFDDAGVGAGSDVFIVLPPAPSGVTTSFGYEWGYALGNQYDDGSFWFTRNGGDLWRDLPAMYEFVFKTYGMGTGIDLPPTACFNWVDADGNGDGTVIDFDASCSSDAKSVVFYEWDWDNDGTYDATGATQSYDFGDTEWHMVTLRVTDDIDQNDTISQQVKASIELVCGTIQYHSGSTDNSFRWTDFTPWICAIELSDPELASYRDGTLTEVTMCIGDDENGYETSPYNIYYATGTLPDITTLTPIASGTGTGWTTVTGLSEVIPSTGSVFVIVEYHDYTGYPASVDTTTYDYRGDWLLYVGTTDDWQHLGDLGYQNNFGIAATVCEP